VYQWVNYYNVKAKTGKNGNLQTETERNARKEYMNLSVPDL
jgi:hypothetical protein